MKFTHKELSGQPSETGVLVLFAAEGSKPSLPSGVRLPSVALSDFRGTFRETRWTDATGGRAKRVLLVGLGKPKDVDLERVRRAAALSVQRAEQSGCASATLVADDALARLAQDAAALGTALSEGALLGSYRFERGKSKPKPVKLKAITVSGKGADFKRGVAEGRALAEATAFARDLQNLPGNKLTPRDLATEAKKLADRSARIRCTVLDEADMRRLGMGLLLSVAQGSDQPPRFVHLVYKPEAKARRGAARPRRIALVGKGLTFDAGGISIKPAAKMDDMRFDMSGGAAVLGVFHALARLDVPHEVHGLVPSTENVINGSATKPGDLFEAMNGTTVEVLNTDAEGRLILADALAYAVAKVEPDTIVDLATLTGAIVVALGHELAGMYATTDRLRDALLAAGRATGENLWPMPLLEHHKEQMRGVVADLRNIAPGDMGAGASAGAAFLSYFTKGVEWAHLDIAGTAYGGANRDWVGGAQGAGFGVRLLLKFLRG